MFPAVLLGLTAIGPAADPPKFLDFLGRADASEVVEIRPRVTGHLLRVLAKDGAAVKAGEVLAEIDPAAARADLDVARARLAQVEARLRMATAEAARSRALVDRAVITREEADRATGAVEVARAEVAEAASRVGSAEYLLSQTSLRSPIDGRLDRFLLTPGNLVTADQTPLVTVVRADPLYVYFDVDEASALKLVRAGKAGGAGFTVAVGFVGEEGFSHEAKVDFTSTRLDPKTGTLPMRATLPNPKGLLLPGMTARVRVPAPDDR